MSCKDFSLAVVAVSQISWCQVATDLRWSPAARLETARSDHCAVTLADGRVMVAGGTGIEGPLPSVEIYGPEDVFRPAPKMLAPHSGHTCTLLTDGRVLVVDETSAELFDPTLPGWASVTSEALPGPGHTATLLREGQVLLAGPGAIAIFDPATNTIAAGETRLKQPRTRHAAALLASGRVLLAGGSDGENALASAEIIDPVNYEVIPAAPMGLPRISPGVAALSDGRILVASGSDGQVELINGELYIESEDRWQFIPAPMNYARRLPFVTQIPGSGLVLIAGGERDGQPVADTEVFEPRTDQFYSIGALTAARSRIAGAVLGSGIVLATGGQAADGPSAACGTLTAPAVTFSSPEYSPSQTVVAHGSGWRASGPPVRLVLRALDGSVRFDSQATPDQNGRFTANLIQAEEADVGRLFTLRATQMSDLSNNLVQFSFTAEASFGVKVQTSLSGGQLVASTPAGASIPFRLTINAARNVGLLRGSLRVQVGPVVNQVQTLHVPGSNIDFRFCCINVPEVHAVNVSYSSDANYRSFNVALPVHTVTPPQVRLSTFPTSLPLNTSTEVQIYVDAGLFPRPTGTVRVSRPGFGPVTLSLAPAPRPGDTRSIAIFSFRATTAEQPSACFDVRYSGDPSYAATGAQLCLAVR
jgi:hypothetical protein